MGSGDEELNEEDNAQWDFGKTKKKKKKGKGGMSLDVDEDGVPVRGADEKA